MLNNLSALFSLFVRLYHFDDKSTSIKVYEDPYAKYMLSKEEYKLISTNLINGRSFFLPNFKGSDKEALSQIVYKQLAPSVLARSAFNLESLRNNISNKTTQYLIFASGYDTSSFLKECSSLNVYEIDRDEMMDDKIKRVKKNDLERSNITYIKTDFTNKDWINSLLNSTYNKEEKSFSSLLGIVYYLSKDEFVNMLTLIYNNIQNESEILFDFPTTNSSSETQKNEELASSAKEKMKYKYKEDEMRSILSSCGFEIVSILNNFDINNSYFSKYNALNKETPILAPQGVNYCLAKKKKSLN